MNIILAGFFILVIIAKVTTDVIYWIVTYAKACKAEANERRRRDDAGDG